ncbi:MAG: hypothetical protein HY549_01315 [Elusimicrobia bacterium]|nr:hypothetical protein [Elusimicrobiota bacterium]
MIFRAFLVFIPLLLAQTRAFAFVTRLKPSHAILSEAQQLVEGELDAELGDQLQLSVEPFLQVAGASSPRAATLIVKDGKFREKIFFYPGLNILKIQPAGGGWSLNRAYYLLGPKEEREKKWGNSSAVIFSQPQEARTESETIELKGAVTDPQLKALDIVCINAVDLLSPGPRQTVIHYYKTPVKNIQFSQQARLTEGLNMILAKPAGKPASYEQVQLKALVYDKANPGILLDEPRIQGKKITISGRTPGVNPKSLRMKVTALARSRDQGLFSVAELYQGELAVQGESFSLVVSLPEQELQPPLTVLVSYLDKASSKTILGW